MLSSSTSADTSLPGRDIPQSVRPGPRAPLPFETSVPGVFAAGDVRYGSVKGVAGAVGEGSVTVGSVHRYLAEAAETHSASSQHIGMPGEYDERRGAARAAAHVDRLP
jgi:hypothetical protein